MRFFDRQKQKKVYRELAALRKDEDDLLAIEEKQEFDAILAELKNSPDPRDAVAVARRKMTDFPLHGNYGTLRNLLDLLLVVGAVAFGLRALFFQPFRIPTSSMQPTLYGIHFRNDLPKCNKFLKALLFGAREAKATTRAPGMLTEIQYHPGFFDGVSFTIGGEKYELPGDVAKVADYADLDGMRFYPAGTTLADGDVVIGDHLFVERFSLYWREPQRGDVMVFTTDGLYSNGRPLSENGGAYYIKRLAALPGDTVKLANDQLFVRPKGAKEFVPIQKLDPRFAKVYSGKGGYQGHNSDMGGQIVYGKNEYTIPEKHYFMLGDNSRFSGDSRFFGAVPRRNLVGRAFLCFWPFSRRIGLVDHNEALDVPTGTPLHSTFPVMWKQ